MVIIFLTLLLIWLCWSWCNKRIYGDIYSPFNLLFYCWIAPFIISLSNASGLQSGLELNAVSLIILTSIPLIAISLLPKLLGFNLSFNSTQSKLFFNARLSCFWPLVFYGITLACVYYAEFNENIPPLYFYLTGGEINSSSHMVGKDSPLQAIGFGIHSLAIIFFYFYLIEHNFIRRKFYLLLSLIPVILGVIKFSKSDIFISVLPLLILQYYYIKFNKLRFSSSYIIIVFIIFLGISYSTVIRMESINTDINYAHLIEFHYENYFGDSINNMLSVIYGYTALGFQNFNNYINTHDIEFRIGASLFRPFLSILMMGNVADEIGVPVDQWNVVSAAANTGTFMTPLYIEGGPLMCITGAIIYSSIVNLSYLFFRLKNSLTFLFIYIIFLFPWTWLFFTNGFSVLSIYINIFYVVFFTKLFIKHRPTYNVL
jgi:hypothetical protein